jgi:nitrogen fixation protein NifU and related proteins
LPLDKNGFTRARISGNMFSSVVLDHFQRPRNVGPLEDAYLGEAGTEGEGLYVKIWLQVSDGIVKRAAYKTYQCPSSIACSSLIAELATNRPLDKLALLEPWDVILVLRGLPDGKDHCAYTAVAALRDALAKAMESQPSV